MTPHETAIILDRLAGAYGREVDERTATVWANTFSDEPYERTARAVQQWIRTEQRFPTPAGIRGLVRDEIRRNNMTAPARELEAGTVTFDEGVQIAYRSYCQEIEWQGRTPRSFPEFRGHLTSVT